MIKAIRHVGLVVHDLPGALRFWCDVLGFRVARKMDEQGPHIDALLGMTGVRLTTAKLAAPDNQLVELLCFHSHPELPRWSGGPNSTGLTHIALTVLDLDATCRAIKADGFETLSDPIYSPDGYAKLVYARGPEGLLLELVQELRS